MFIQLEWFCRSTLLFDARPVTVAFVRSLADSILVPVAPVEWRLG